MEKTIDIGIITPITKKAPYIDSNGNVSYKENSDKVCISVKQNEGENFKLKKVSKEYYFMSEISNDHYIVCDVNNRQFLEKEEEFDDSYLSFKFGVIALQRDSEGNIIPFAEKTVVPKIYDDIAGNNLQTITAFVNERSTYIDIDPASENYGKQLVPAVLGYALPFSEKYEGFAECSVDGIRGYLPRTCQPKTSLSPVELLTEEQVKNILLYLETDNNHLSRSSFNK